MATARLESAAASPVVRAATESDAAAVASLLTELGYPANADQARERLRAHSGDFATAFVAESHGEVAGCISAHVAPYFPDGSIVCRITALVVASRHRRRGIGVALINAVCGFGRERGCTAVELTTAERRKEAHAFYEAAGFARTSLRFVRGL